MLCPQARHRINVQPRNTRNHHDISENLFDNMYKLFCLSLLMHYFPNLRQNYFAEEFQFDISTLHYSLLMRVEYRLATSLISYSFL